MAGAGAGGGGRRVVLFPFPYQGHFNPVMRLASALHARGLAITVFHTEIRSPDPADYPGDYRFVSLPVEVPPELVASEDIAKLVTAMNVSSEAPFRDRLAALLAEEEGGGGVRCVITDVTWYSAQAVAKDLGVQALGIMTASAATFRVYMAYHTLIDKAYLPVQEARKDDPVHELPPYRVNDLLRHDTCSLVEFADLLRHMVAGARQSSSGLIINTFGALEATNLDQIRDDLSIPVFAVAPLNKLAPPAKAGLYGGEVQADRRCLGWLDTQVPGTVLYVSFGSLAAMDPHEFVELAWGLALSKRPFLWVVRPKLIRGFESGDGDLPDGLDEEVRGRGSIVSWAPQEEVLAHLAVGAFFTHSGWNSTMEAISEGVPMICHPLHGDQYGNARYVCDVWKVGVELEGRHLERGKIKAAIDKMMDSKEGREIRERMSGLKMAAEKGIKEHGASHTDLVKLIDLIKSS